MNVLRKQPVYVNTWGDAIFAVMDEAVGLAVYACTLLQVVLTTPWAERGLPEDLSVRIALDAGPTFEGSDPFTGKGHFYGSHVNRAARIEPIAIPGHVYARERFAALLMREQLRTLGSQRSGGESARLPFTCHYVGTLLLAKGYGSQAIYRIRREKRPNSAT